MKRIRHKIILVEGWQPDFGEGGWRWIISSSIKGDTNLLHMIFFIPNINYYKNKRLIVTMKIGNNQRSVIVTNEGEIILTISIHSLCMNKFLYCEIISNEDFCPAKITDSPNNRNLSIIVNRFELSKDDYY